MIQLLSEPEMVQAHRKAKKKAFKKGANKDFANVTFFDSQSCKNKQERKENFSDLSRRVMINAQH